MHLSPLRNSITSITTDLWQKICIVTKQNALFKEILNFLIDLRSVEINLHKGVPITPPAANCALDPLKQSLNLTDPTPIYCVDTIS